MRARADDAGPNDPDFPTCCPNCGDENLGLDDELLDESYLSCGNEQCIEALRKLEAEDRAADEARAAEYNAKREQELLERDPEP